MKIDNYGQHIYTESDVCDLYMTDPERTIKQIIVNDNVTISDILDYDKIPKFIVYSNTDLSITDFDSACQSDWFIPDDYKTLDIAKYILDLCQTDEELQRVGHELLLFQERDMFPLLQYLKYLVDIMRDNKIVWGVGRGSSVSSYVLFLLGVHRINSLYYDLSIDEFLK
jgi:hypothetical protein